MKIKVTMRILILLSVFITLMFFLKIKVNAAEPSLLNILNGLGFVNIAETSMETFPRGLYEITLYAEYAAYRDSNILSWYKVGTSDFNLIFSGPEGVPPSQSMGLVSPPLTKSVSIDDEFGLSLLSPDGRWFSETSRNSDGKKHAKIYQSLDDPNLFFVGFENLKLGGDFDFNDMVLSLKHIIPVGGVWMPINKPQLLAPSMASTSMTIIITVAFILFRRKKNKMFSLNSAN